MSYSSARTLAQNAKSSSSDEAIQKLADAIHALSRAVEHDIQELERKINQIKNQ
jgi:hypothetical protein